MKSLVSIILAVAVAAVVSGCATPPATHGSIITTDGGKVTENRSDYANYTQAKLALATKPLFEMECPAEGCVIKSLKVNNPNAGGDIAAPAAPPRIESAAVGVAREFKETLLGMTPLAIAYTTGKTVQRIFESSNAANVSLASRIQAPQANQTINVTGSNSSAAFGGAASSVGPVTNTTTANTTSTVTRTNTSVANTSTNTATNTNSGNTSTNTNSGNTTTTTTPTTVTCTNGNATGTPSSTTGAGTGTGTTTQTCR
jgi:hypothetical protein